MTKKIKEVRKTGGIGCLEFLTSLIYLISLRSHNCFYVLTHR